MLRDEIETILKRSGWIRTLGAPAGVIDYQRSEPYNRIIVYPEDTQYITSDVLGELMNEINLGDHGTILYNAKEKFMKGQVTFPLPTEEDMKRKEHELRDKIVRLIDGIPVEYLPDLIKKLQEFWVEKKGKKFEEPVIRESVKHWEERAVEEQNVAVIGVETERDYAVAIEIFTMLRDEKKDYRSAVVIDSTKVRMVECERGKLHGGVIVLNAATIESALGIRMLLDGTLNREVKIISVVGTETNKQLTVSFVTTGIKPLKKKAKLKVDTESVYEGDETLDFWKKKRGEK
jgi:hypothetical protein